MRAIVGFIFLQGLMTVAGAGVLRALGLLTPGVSAFLPGAGAAWLTGTSLVLLCLIALMVVGAPLTVGVTALVALGVAGCGFAVARRHRAGSPPRPPSNAGSSGRVSTKHIAVGVAAAYLVVGFYALSRAPTQSDDARIWSLKGLALTYYDTLRPEIFLNPATTLSHPVYPLFQPVLEAVLGRAMGHPELRLVHAELWLLIAAAIWTAAYLIWWRCSRPLREQAGLALLALVAVTPAVVSNISAGFADATGAVLLTTGAVAIGVWIEGGSGGHLWLGAILLAAAGNTKDEDMVGAALVLLVAAIVLAARRDRARLRQWLGGAALCAVLIMPWRIWTAAHHLRDSVQPPLPRALSPVFVLDRLSQLHQTASAMITDVLSGWGWLAAIFLALCVLCLATRTARRLAAFYLLTFGALVASLLWLYTTTPISLSFLIPTSMSRTVTVFMALTPFASAHLLARMLAATDLARRLSAAGPTPPPGLPAGKRETRN